MHSDPKLKYAIFGIEHGDFSPANQSKESFLRQVEKAKKLLPGSVSLLFAPFIGFTNKLAELGQDDDVLTPWLVRTKSKTDAGIVEKPGIAIAFFNGDCPILCLQERNKLAAAHLGYRCIIRENPEEEGIIEASLRYFNPEKVEAFIFGGIGPCCWVPEKNKAEVNHPKRCRHPEILVKCLSKTTCSPLGKNLVSVDLYKLSRFLLLKMGLLPHQINWKSRCTCCSYVQENGEPVFWSHTRFLAKGGTDGRNFVAAWLE